MENEKRLIDANACPCIKCDRIGNCRPGLCEAFTEWWFSSVDAVEVVHGRWIYEPVEFTYEKDIKCSVCGSYVECVTNYCPNCGAKVDGAQE